MAKRRKGTYRRSLQLLAAGDLPAEGADAVAVDPGGGLAGPALGRLSHPGAAVLLIVPSGGRSERRVSAAPQERILVLRDARSVWYVGQILAGDPGITHVGLDERAYCADCAIEADRSDDPCALARARTATEAVAAGVQPLAGLPPWQPRDGELVNLARLRRQHGFKGMFGWGSEWIMTANCEFTPAAEQVRFAKRALAAFAAAELEGAAAVEVDGRLVDVATVQWAVQTLEWQKAVSQCR